MAISSKIEEIILELSKTAGNIYDALTLGLGDLDKPNSSIFELNNLLSLANNGFPSFGVVETSPLGFGLTYDLTNDPYYLTVNGGQVSFDGSLLQTSTQKIPLKKEWSKDYSDTLVGSDGYKYGITIGLPYEEVQKASQLYSTTVTQNTSANSSLLYVNDTNVAQQLGFPIQGVVGTNVITFSGVNTDRTALIIDPSYYNGSSFGVLSSQVFANTTVTFIFQPKLKYITGFPVEEALEYITGFKYFPPLPQSWLPVAKVLCKNPENPVIISSGTGFTRTVIDMPTATSNDPILGTSDDKNLIIQNCNDTILLLQNYKTNDYLNVLINGIFNYISFTAVSGGLTIRELLATQPFRPNEFYSKGLSFSGLERFEFPYNFARAYYNSTGQDLQHTFAVFRGDLNTYNSAIGNTLNFSATGLTTSTYSCSNYQSSLHSGTQIYGVSTVYNISGTEYVESNNTYTNLITPSIATNNYLVELNWSGTAISNVLFYNIYKKPRLTDELYERKITNVDEIQYPAYNTLPSFTDDTSLPLVNGLSAFLFQAPENAYIGGISFKLLYDAGSQTTGTGSTGLAVSMFSATGSTPTYNGMISSESYLRYSDISQGTNTYTVKFDNGVNVTEDSFYYVMINKPESFSTALGTTSLYIRTISGISGLAKTSINNATSWTGTGGTLWFQARGYLDNGNIIGDVVRKGISLTNKKSFTPRRLSVYVPPVDDLTTSAIRLNGSATGIATTSDTTTKNEVTVYVTAQNGDFGQVKTLSATVPQGTVRNTRFELGTTVDLFDRVLDVYVVPGTNLNRVDNGPIIWDIYDLITVETIP